MHVRRALVVRPCPPPRSAARTGRLALLRLRSSHLKLPRTEITNGLKQLAPLECLSHAGFTEIVVNHVAEVVDGFDAVSGCMWEACVSLRSCGIGSFSTARSRSYSHTT